MNFYWRIDIIKSVAALQNNLNEIIRETDNMSQTKIINLLNDNAVTLSINKNLIKLSKIIFMIEYEFSKEKRKEEELREMEIQ